MLPAGGGGSALPGAKGSKAARSQMTSIANVNAFINCLSYHDEGKRLSTLPHDTLSITVTTNKGQKLASANVDVLIINRAVAIMTHTHGRVAYVHEVARLLARWYPGTTIHCTNDDTSLFADA